MLYYQLIISYRSYYTKSCNELHRMKNTVVVTVLNSIFGLLICGSSGSSSDITLSLAISTRMLLSTSHCRNLVNCCSWSLSPVVLGSRWFLVLFHVTKTSSDNEDSTNGCSIAAYLSDVTPSDSRARSCVSNWSYNVGNGSLCYPFVLVNTNFNRSRT